ALRADFHHSAFILNGRPRRGLLHSAFITQHSNLYCTGDLARWLPGGAIEFLGRIDHQVKIRGYRIELPELENHLLKFARIQNALVTVFKDDTGENRLVAYVVSNDEETGKLIDDTREFLRARLPGYMIPSFFVILKELPMTINGKIDRKALPHPEVKTRWKFVAPGNPIEEKIAGTWKNILKLDQIDVNTSFFNLGGTSLNIIQVNTQLKNLFNIDVPVAVMFEHPTVRSLSEYIMKKIPGGALPADETKNMFKAIHTGRNKLKDRKKMITGD
ncbi:MAG: phosphopantetheine-binding protein, partial [Acidobacteria bacterium]|nr:phosphopantetheine-binding protein [Acidobacteriota bacterium]